MRGCREEDGPAGIPESYLLACWGNSAWVGFPVLPPEATTSSAEEHSLTATVQAVCPNCTRTFEVPDGAAEAACVFCGELIVWRRCLDTDEVFPVLWSWTTWVHPGCPSQHAVDLSVHIPALDVAPDADDAADLAGAPETPHDLAGPASSEVAPTAAAPSFVPVVLSEHAFSAERQAAGRLVLEHDRMTLVPDEVGTPPVVLVQLWDLTGYRVDPGSVEEHAAPEVGRKRFRRGKAVDAPAEGPATRLSLFTTTGVRAIDVADSEETLSATLLHWLGPGRR